MVFKGLICREFGWTPMELAEQPANEVFEMWNAVNYFDERMLKLSRRGE